MGSASITPYGRYRQARAGTPAHLVTVPRRVPALPLTFTVHLCFGAITMDDARRQAVSYAEALSIVRTEIAVGASWLSYADEWHRAERLFCPARSPDGGTCAGVLGHGGPHGAARAGGPTWSDDEPGPPAGEPGRR
nr:hypothetical protein [Micromonospora sp. DSM 115978]